MSFKIDIKILSSGEDDPQGIKMSAQTHVLTRLLREGQNNQDDHLRAPPSSLAYWLTDNWWRLRWEPMNPEESRQDSFNSESRFEEKWRLAHDVSSNGGGIAWPRIKMWGEGERIGILAEPDPLGVIGPVRFLADCLVYVSATEWEAEVDKFLYSIVDTQSGFGSDRSALSKAVAELNSERQDTEIATWRRMEARLGYDVDEVPDELIESFTKPIAIFGEENIEEAIQASPGDQSADNLNDCIEAANSSRLICRFDVIQPEDRIGFEKKNEQVWELAEGSAAKIRQRAGSEFGPIRNNRLAELLGIGVNALKSVEKAPAENLPYGIRLQEKSVLTDHKIALRSRWSRQRRFELSRALGDVIWAENTSLGPMARTQTDRQRFQRSFAQSLLCPYDDLKDFVGNREITEDTVSQAAEHFHVSPLLIETTLVKKGDISASRFWSRIEAA